MKRKVMTTAFVVAIAIVSGINVFNAQKPAVLSDVAMENVEALAAGEVIPGYTGPAELYDCPLWLTGDGVFCKSENERPCSVITCN